MSALFSPLQLRGVILRNRVIVSPMCQYSSEDGRATNWHFVHLGSRAVGGAGMVVAEATAVVPEGRISPQDSGLWNDAQVEAWKPITKFIKENGAVPAIQLAHAGRKASTFAPWDGEGPVGTLSGWTAVAPSSLAFDQNYPAPRELAEQEVASIPRRFADSARRAVAAGFEAIELHFAHGYLVHSFLSPLTNRRKDSYGGNYDRRVRVATDIAAAVRREIPERMPLLARISATDWVDGGWDLPQTVELSKRLKADGVDLIDCSTGGLMPRVKVPIGPGYQVPFAQAVRREAGIATGAVGMITDPKQAEEIVASGKADAVILARELLRDPYWPLRASTVLGAKGAWPKQYARAKP